MNTDHNRSETPQNTMDLLRLELEEMQGDIQDQQIAVTFQKFRKDVQGVLQQDISLETERDKELMKQLLYVLTVEHFGKDFQQNDQLQGMIMALNWMISGPEEKKDVISKLGQIVEKMNEMSKDVPDLKKEVEAHELIPAGYRIDKDTSLLDKCAHSSFFRSIRLKPYIKPKQREEISRRLMNLRISMREEMSPEDQAKLLQVIRTNLLNLTLTFQKSISSPSVLNELGFRKILTGKMAFSPQKNMVAIAGYIVRTTECILKEMRSGKTLDEALATPDLNSFQFHKSLTENINIGKGAIELEDRTNNSQSIGSEEYTIAQDHYFYLRDVEAMALMHAMLIDLKAKRGIDRGQFEERMQMMAVEMAVCDHYKGPEHVKETIFDRYVKGTPNRKEAEESFEKHFEAARVIYEQYMAETVQTPFDEIDESFSPFETFNLISEDKKQERSVIIEMMDRQEFENHQESMEKLLNSLNKLTERRQEMVLALVEDIIGRLEDDLKYYYNQRKNNYPALDEHGKNYWKEVHHRSEDDEAVNASSLMRDVFDLFEVSMNEASGKSLEQVLTSNRWLKILVGFQSQLMGTCAAYPMTEEVRKSLVTALRKSLTKEDRKESAKRYSETGQIHVFDPLHIQDLASRILETVVLNGAGRHIDSERIRLVSLNHFDQLVSDDMDEALDITQFPKHLQTPTDFLLYKGHYGSCQIETDLKAYNILIKKVSEANFKMHFTFNKKEVEKAKNSAIRMVVSLSSLAYRFLDKVIAPMEAYREKYERLINNVNPLPYPALQLLLAEVLEEFSSALTKQATKTFSRKQSRDATLEIIQKYSPRIVSLFLGVSEEEIRELSETTPEYFKTAYSIWENSHSYQSYKNTPKGYFSIDFLDDNIDSYFVRVIFTKKNETEDLIEFKKRKDKYMEEYRKLRLEYEQQTKKTDDVREKSQRYQQTPSQKKKPRDVPGHLIPASPSVRDKETPVTHIDHRELLTDSPLLGKLKLDTTGIDPKAVEELNERINHLALSTQESIRAWSRECALLFTRHAKTLWNQFYAGRFNNKEKVQNFLHGKEALPMDSFDEALTQVYTTALGMGVTLDNHGKCNEGTFKDRQWTAVLHDPLKEWAQELTEASSSRLKPWLKDCEKEELDTTKLMTSCDEISLMDLAQPSISWLAGVIKTDESELQQLVFSPELSELEKQELEVFIEQLLQVNKRDNEEVSLALLDEDLYKIIEHEISTPLIKMLNEHGESPYIKRDLESVKHHIRAHLEKRAGKDDANEIIEPKDAEEHTVEDLIHRHLTQRVNEAETIVLRKTEDEVEIVEEDIEALIEVEKWLEEYATGRLSDEQRGALQMRIDELRELITDNNESIRSQDDVSETEDDNEPKQEPVDENHPSDEEEGDQDDETEKELDEDSLPDEEPRDSDDETGEVDNTKKTEDILRGAGLTGSGLSDLAKRLERFKKKAQDGEKDPHPDKEPGITPKDKTPESVDKAPTFKPDQDLVPPPLSGEKESKTTPDKKPDPAPKKPSGTSPDPTSPRGTPTSPSPGEGSTVVVPPPPSHDKLSAEEFLRAASEHQVMSLFQDRPELIQYMQEHMPGVPLKAAAGLVARLMPEVNGHLLKRIEEIKLSEKAREFTRPKQNRKPRTPRINENIDPEGVDQEMMKLSLIDLLKDYEKNLKREEHKERYRDRLAEIGLEYDVQAIDSFLRQVFGTSKSTQAGHVSWSAVHAVVEETGKKYEEDSHDEVHLVLREATMEYAIQVLHETMTIPEEELLKVDTSNTLTEGEQQRLRQMHGWLSDVVKKVPLGRARTFSITMWIHALYQDIGSEYSGAINTEMYPVLIALLNLLKEAHYVDEKVKGDEIKRSLRSSSANIDQIRSLNRKLFASSPTHFQNLIMNRVQGKINHLQKHLRELSDKLTALRNRIQVAESTPVDQREAYGEDLEVLKANKSGIERQMQFLQQKLKSIEQKLKHI